MLKSSKLFVEYSYDKIGPYFIFDDINKNIREKMYINLKILSIEVSIR